MSTAELVAEPTPLRWTTAEYRRMNELGLFIGRRCMLLSGVIWEQHHSDPVDPSPRKVKFTRDEYRWLAEKGFFHGRRVCLLNGEVLLMAAMKEPHLAGISVVSDVFRAVFGIGFHVRAQGPLDVNTANDPEPDVVVVPGNARTYRNSPTAPAASVALVVVEVADTTLTQDTTTKAELYATAGVADYWVLDVVNDQLLVFRDPQPIAGAVAYRTRHALTAADTITLLAVPNTPIPVADLLP